MFYSRIAIAVFVFVATIETLYWPLLPKPGTPYEWWEVKWLAQAGLYLGFVPLVLTSELSKWDLPDNFLQPTAWLLALAWALSVYWLVGLVLIRLLSRRRSASVAPENPGAHDTGATP